MLAHVIHAFAWPNDGSIDSYDGMFGSGISEAIHAQDRKFILSLGGWGNVLNFICADPDLENFINLISIILINGYDGADIDWGFLTLNRPTNLNLWSLRCVLHSLMGICSLQWLYLYRTAGPVD